MTRRTASGGSYGYDVSGLRQRTETRWSRSRLRAWRRPRTDDMRMSSPSRATQWIVDCGEPSLLTVDNVTNDGPSSHTFAWSGMPVMYRTLRGLVAQQRGRDRGQPLAASGEAEPLGG